MKTTQEVLKPTMPERIYFKQKSRGRQFGFNANKGVLVSDLTREEAEQYAELMRKTFIEYWEKSQK